MQTSKCKPGRELGKGRSGYVERMSSPVWTPAVMKSGQQGHLAAEAEKMACASHPSVVRLHAFMREANTDPHPDQQGYLVMEEVATNLDEYLQTHE